MPKKLILTTRFLKHGAEFSAILVHDAKVVARKLDAVFYILLWLADETGICISLDEIAGPLIWVSFSME